MYKKSITSKWKVPIGAFLIMILLAASLQYCSGLVSASNSVNGRELPIYCVETKEKKVALSFDAAWADYNLRKK